MWMSPALVAPGISVPSFVQADRRRLDVERASAGKGDVAVCRNIHLARRADLHAALDVRRKLVRCPVVPDHRAVAEELAPHVWKSAGRSTLPG